MQSPLRGWRIYFSITPDLSEQLGSAPSPIHQSVKHSQYPMINPSIMVHRLNVSPSFPPIRQKKRVFAQERDRAIAEKVHKLQNAEFIKEVYYLDWLANVVMIKKANGKKRMCIDFTDLNKACPKDSYLLPLINVLIDSTVKHQLLSFKDAFSSYN